MPWEVDRRDFSVRLTNEFGQYATGDSQESYEEALQLAHINASRQKPPVYQPRHQPPVQRAIDDFL